MPLKLDLPVNNHRIVKYNKSTISVKKQYKPMAQDREQTYSLPAKKHRWHVAQSHKGDKYDRMGWCSEKASHESGPIVHVYYSGA